MTSMDPSERPDDAVLRAVAGAFEDAWNQHDAQRIAEVFTEDTVMDDPGAPETVLRGRLAIRAYFESWLRAFPDAQLRQDVLFTPLDGDEYASRWRIWGTMQQDLRPPRFAATHRRVETEGVAIMERSGSSCRAAGSSTTPTTSPASSALPPRGSRLERVGVLLQRLSVALKARTRRT